MRVDRLSLIILRIPWIAEYLKTVPVFQDYRQVFSTNQKLDWVLICSKNCLHRDHCVETFNANKHIFCEKPLAVSIQQCKEILEAQRKSNKIMLAGFVLRYSPFYRHIKSIVDSGVIGTIVSIDANEILDPGHGGYFMR